jgi:pimeloyl-ACP methyl ester carboxylesterase
MGTTLSKDGTRIGFTRAGTGPALVLVDGALCYRAFGPSGPLAAALADRFTVFTYDRRGRGESGNTLPFAVQREIEDLDAVIRETGGPAFVFGASSGGALALEAANQGLAIKKLVVYEIPFIVDNTRPPIPEDFLDRLHTALAAGRPGDAVTHFMKLVGAPSVMVAMMRLFPVWKKLKAVAHTLPYDITLVKDYERGQPLRTGQWANVAAPTLVMDGGKSPAWIRNAMRSLADVLPKASYRTLEGQTHMVKPRAQVPALVEFLTSTARDSAYDQKGFEAASHRIGEERVR